MATERVTCPECGTDIDVELLHYGFIPMIEQCPACGVGPIALLDRMADALGGDAATGRAAGFVDGPEEDPIFSTPPDDAAMDAAIAQARATVDRFIARLHDPHPEDHTFGVKAAFVDRDEVEHMWVNDVHQEFLDYMLDLANRWP
jgi:hypothetical protein